MTYSGGQQAVFGPVPSRRLGLSLGVDLVYPKTCPLDCIYCELGRTTVHTTQRGVFRDVDQVLAQVERRLGELAEPPDFLTLAGSGEPTLHLELGRAIAGLRKLGVGRVAVLTNGVLLSDPRVRDDLAEAQVVIPSLDAATQEVFEAINRPAPGLIIDDVIEGLRAFAAGFQGRLWLEILLAAGVNDSPEHLEALGEAARGIGPELVQLNTVIRPPAVAGVKALGATRLEAIAAGLGLPCEVSAPPTARAGLDRGQAGDQVVEMTRRRPCTLSDVAAAVGLDSEGAQRLLHELSRQGKLEIEEHSGETYYRGV
ncbi:MAG: radical SAM protein [Desulfarculaceae bacterium]|nr:radical SAM protein [Desulfarculaceae bacterium]MCF8074072.1 radical SAM protein [Desulfarculaceae bacterium]MCF8102090.1 radical SAM protein [Desulfarculaceae bacterium]MCF8117628.1 radical SAM protein [Desulfarculaceae bacterium]